MGVQHIILWSFREALKSPFIIPLAEFPEGPMGNSNIQQSVKCVISVPLFAEPFWLKIVDGQELMLAVFPSYILKPYTVTQLHIAHAHLLLDSIRPAPITCLGQARAHPRPRPNTTSAYPARACHTGQAWCYGLALTHAEKRSGSDCCAVMNSS